MPSNRTSACVFPFASANRKRLRYHPVPPTTQPVASCPALNATSNGPMRVGVLPPTHIVPSPASAVGVKSSILQSCGRSTVRQLESSKPGFSAPAISPRKNLQFSSNTCSRTRSEMGAPSCPRSGPKPCRSWAFAVGSASNGNAPTAPSPFSASRRLIWMETRSILLTGGTKESFHEPLSSP